MFKSIIAKFSANLKRLFILDGLGALVSALYTGIVLNTFRRELGLSENLLLILGGIALVLFLYDFSCYYFLKNNVRPFITFAIIANILYFIGISVYIAVVKEIGPLGKLCLVAESIVLFLVIIFEIQVLRKK